MFEEGLEQRKGGCRLALLAQDDLLHVLGPYPGFHRRVFDGLVADLCEEDGLLLGLSELFELFGKSSADYLELKPLTPWYRFYFEEDGSTFDYGGTLRRMKALVAASQLAADRRIVEMRQSGQRRLVEKTHLEHLFAHLA